MFLRTVVSGLAAQAIPARRTLAQSSRRVLDQKIPGKSCSRTMFYRNPHLGQKCAQDRAGCSRTNVPRNVLEQMARKGVGHQSGRFDLDHLLEHSQAAPVVLEHCSRTKRQKRPFLLDHLLEDIRPEPQKKERPRNPGRLL